MKMGDLLKALVEHDVVGKKDFILIVKKVQLLKMISRIFKLLTRSYAGLYLIIDDFGLLN
jgi:hypothetical protein